MEMSMIQNQMQGVVSLQGGREAALSSGLFGGMSGDPFLEIFMRMAEGMMESGDLTNMTQGEDEGNETTDVLLQSFAAMLHANPLLAAQLPVEMEQMPQAGVAGMEELIQKTSSGTVSQEQLLTMLQGIVQNKAIATVSVKEQPKPAGFMLNQDVEMDVEGLTAKEMKAIVVQSSTSQGGAAQEIMEVQRQFSTAVDTAKRQLQGQKTQDDKSQKVELETFALRPETNASEVIKGKEIIPLEKANLTEQIQTEIKTHLTKGESEFTMKLKPEALGEITVKMTKTDGKVTVQIVAASQQTSQLLNRDIGMLRDALRPLQAEVQQVITTENTSTQHGMEQFNMQHFAQQNKNGSTHHSGASSYEDRNNEEEVATEQAAEQQSANWNVYV